MKREGEKVAPYQHAADQIKDIYCPIKLYWGYKVSIIIIYSLMLLARKLGDPYYPNILFEEGHSKVIDL